MRLRSGLVQHLGKTVIVNFTRWGHMIVKDVACDGLPCVVAGVGKYMGVWLGPGSFPMLEGCGAEVLVPGSPHYVHGIASFPHTGGL